MFALGNLPNVANNQVAQKNECSEEDTSPKMLTVAKKLEDKSLFLRLNPIPNAEVATANNVQYHRMCWVLAQRKAKSEAPSPQEFEEINRLVADIEIISMVEGFLQNSSDIVLEMKSLNIAYNMLKDTDVETKQKRYLQQLLLENITDAQFICPPARNQSEQICSSHGQSKAVEKNFQNTYDSFQNIFQAAKIVTRWILTEDMWQFNGSCDGFNVPRSLELLFRWILCGPSKDSETAHRNEIDKSVNILSELVMNMIKSNRQLQYDSHRSNDRA